MRTPSVPGWLAGTLVVMALAGLALVSPARAEDEVDELQEKAIKEAVRKIAPAVVKIETSGGTDVVGSGSGGGGPARGGRLRADDWPDRQPGWLRHFQRL
jgi:hypothetical protein